MQLAMIGLGRMGANMVRRLLRAGHECVVFDVSKAAVERAGAGGGHRGDRPRRPGRQAGPAPPRVDHGAGRVRRLDRRRPGRGGCRPTTASSTGATATTATTSPGRRGCADRGIHYVDVGTSGGVFGLERGYCLMVGGDAVAVQRLDPVFAALAPGVATAPRTPGRDGEPSTAEQGYLHCGPSGAGHFVKMVHNGIEYGMMAALAEGSGSSTKPMPAPASGRRTPRPPPCRTRRSTSTRSTSPRSPSCGGEAA